MLLSRYTENVYLIYDGDEAGQRAAQRAIPMLERAGLQVRVLRLKDAKDPDEFLKKFGADRFKLLLEGSENRVEYQLQTIRSRYDLQEDAQRVDYLREAAELLATLPSAVQREVYGNRVAQLAGITYEAMKLETDKAYRRLKRREEKRQERMDLSPEAQQPRSRSIRYHNLRSAMAEEGVVATVLKEPGVLDTLGDLSGAQFSSPLLGRVFDEFVRRHSHGLLVSMGALENLNSEEASHLASILQKHNSPVSQEALEDYVRTILEESGKTKAGTVDDLMALREKMKRSKGLGT